MARVGQINRLTWEDVNLNEKYVVLYTRKKRGGHLTPRKVPMTQRLFETLSKRYAERDKNKPWVFWTRFTDRSTGKTVEGPYRQYRGTILPTLCKKARVKPFTFHGLRHAGASMMDKCNVSIGVIQKLLGHENRTTTEIYLHVLRDSERDAIAAYERALQKSHTNSHTEANDTGETKGNGVSECR